MQPVISSWLNLVKIIFKPENETIYSTNDHLWRFKLAKYFAQEMKKFCRWGRRQEAQVAVNRDTGKERTRFCSIIGEFLIIFVVSCNNNAIFVAMQYLKFGFPLKVINSIYDWCIIYPHFVNQKINYQNVTAIEMSTKQPKTTSYLWKCPVSRPQTPRLRNFVRFHGFVGFISWFWRKWGPVCENWS